MVRRDGWSAMFSTAFKRSRNAMLLLDDRRRVVDVNGAYLRRMGYSRKAVIGEPIYHFVVGGPVVSAERWAELLTLSDFTGEVSMVGADGSHVAVQWGAHTELVTGHRLVLFVALSTSRWGQRFRRSSANGPSSEE